MTSRSISQAHPVFTRGNDTVERNTAAYASSTPARSRSLAPGMFQQGTLFEDGQAALAGIRAHGGRVYRVGRKVCPSRRETVRSASKAEYIDFTRLSKPLKTESR